MNEVLNKFGPLAGRILMAVIFLLSGVGKIGNFAGTAAYMAHQGVPLTELALVITIVIEVGGAALLILGWNVRFVAGVLFLWMIPVTLMFHNFWAAPADQHMIQQIMFLKNLAMMGGFLYVMTFGAGPYSLDRK
ncbi:MAG TPA: DoxX family protein [Candidatus Methylomirabilis sp.]|nr:DoxX family protein [Candidatus Methylomirabilis sp.]